MSRDTPVKVLIQSSIWRKDLAYIMQQENLKKSIHFQLSFSFELLKNILFNILQALELAEWSMIIQGTN